MGRIEDKLRELGLTLPTPLALPSPNRTAAVLIEHMLYLSGHGAQLLEDDKLKRRGKVGRDLTEQEAYDVARALAIKMMASAKRTLGDLDRIARVVKLVGMVNAGPEFERPNAVINGASD